MVEWKLTTTGHVAGPGSWLDVGVPGEWLGWHYAYLWSIPLSPDTQDYDHNAILLETGCDNGDGDVLNCTKTCGSVDLMFASPENLWNCMTLAAVAARLGSDDDTVNPDDEQETDDVFHFGSLDEFSELGTFSMVYDCLQESCSTSEYGTCPGSLSSFHFNSTTQQANMTAFGHFLRAKYCDDFDAGIDSDIAGQGVLISYMIQYLLVIIISISFRLTYSHSEKPTSEPRPTRRRARCAARFAGAVASTLVDLQEAQALFTLTISIATIAIFANSSASSLASEDSLFSYVVNMRISQAIITIGMFPLVVLQSMLQSSGSSSGYTLLFTVVDWILVLFVQYGQEVDARARWSTIQASAVIPACGDKPGPMAYCARPLERTTHGAFQSGVPASQGFAYFMVPILMLDWARRFLSRRPGGSLGGRVFAALRGAFEPLMAIFRKFDRTSKFRRRFGSNPISAGIRVAVEVVSLAMLVLGFTALLLVFRDLYKSDSDRSSWSFGQLAALAIWLPVVSKFTYFLIHGVKDGVEGRIEKQYEVRRRQAIAPEEAEREGAGLENTDQSNDDTRSGGIKAVGESVSEKPPEKSHTL
ncbi:hypothetical protein ACJ41O_010242 [Fusarium nematophilum]